VTRDLQATTATTYITRPLPSPGAARLRDAGIEVIQQAEDRPATRAELLEHVAPVDALVCTLADRIDDEVLSAAPRLRVVANLAVGFDNIDVAAATAHGVVVTNTPDVLTEATADLAWTLVLAAARRAGEGERLVRAGRWPGWGPTQLLGQPVWGRTLGIVGLGKIGRAVARRARGFDMTVLYCNRRPDPAAERELGVRYAPLDDLLARADVVSLHAPLNDESRHLIDADSLARMRPTAVLVNTARGALIDEEALVAALQAGTIAAAGLDVFEHEPKLTPGLTDLEQVVVLPHIGSATTEARGAMAELCCTNILAVLRSEQPPTPLNPEVLDDRS
jgi:glyoxylate reductase